MSNLATMKTTHLPIDGEYVRVHRLLRILTLIQQQDGWDAKALAQECNVGERTIFRDLKMLEGAGIPYYFDEARHGYRIRGDFFMQPIELTLEEALAIVALGEHIGGSSQQMSFMQPAARAVAKIRGELPERLRRNLEKVYHHVAIRIGHTALEVEAEDVYVVMQQAVSEHLAVDCEYESAGRQQPASRFTFHPYTLFFSKRAWYVIGHHGRHGEIRCLKISRFTQARITDRHFDFPAGFSLDKHLGNAWWMIRGEKRYKVELRFDAEFADNIESTHWHKTQETQWNDDGSLTFHCKVDGLDEIVWWVLSMGPHCTVVEPPELASRVCKLGQQMLQQYRKP